MCSCWSPEGSRERYGYATAALEQSQRGTQLFDIITTHGCHEELVALLTKLGYEPAAAGAYRHPQSRKAVFVGDLVDRGPKIPETVILVKGMVDAGDALCVP
jgi:protein phosphatase